MASGPNIRKEMLAKIPADKLKTPTLAPQVPIGLDMYQIE